MFVHTAVIIKCRWGTRWLATIEIYFLEFKGWYSKIMCLHDKVLVKAHFLSSTINFSLCFYMVKGLRYFSKFLYKGQLNHEVIWVILIMKAGGILRN